MKQLKDLNIDRIFINPPPAHEFTTTYQIRKQFQIPNTKKDAQKRFNDEINKSVLEHMELFKGLENENLKINYYDYEYSSSKVFLTVAPFIIGFAFMYKIAKSGQNIKSLFIKNALLLNSASLIIALTLKGKSNPVPVPSNNINNIETTFSLLSTIMYDAGKTKYGF